MDIRLIALTLLFNLLPFLESYCQNKPVSGQNFVQKPDSVITQKPFPDIKSGLTIEIAGKTYSVKEEDKHEIFGVSLDLINVVSQILAFIGLVTTLFYLAIQTRIANKNNLLGAFQHTQDNINQFNDVIAASSDLAQIIANGRQSYIQLSAVDKLRFEHTYGRLLNILEGWYILTEQLTKSDFKKSQADNIKSVIAFYFSYPGVIEFWNTYQSMYIAELAQLIAESIVLPVVTDNDELPTDAGDPVNVVG